MFLSSNEASYITINTEWQKNLFWITSLKDQSSDMISSMDKIETMFQTMGESPYAQNPNYTNLLTSVYTDRIKPIIETENMLVPKKKPLFQQMDYLK